MGKIIGIAIDYCGNNSHLVPCVWVGSNLYKTMYTEFIFADLLEHAFTALLCIFKAFTLLTTKQGKLFENAS